MELTINNIIKIILGILVVAAVAYGVYSFFHNSFGSFIENTGVNNSNKFLLSLLK